MNLKSSSDMKFKKSRKKEATINVSHDRQVQEILNKVEHFQNSIDFLFRIINQFQRLCILLLILQMN